MFTFETDLKSASFVKKKSETAHLILDLDFSLPPGLRGRCAEAKLWAARRRHYGGPDQRPRADGHTDAGRN